MLYSVYSGGVKWLSDAVMKERAVYLGNSHADHNWIHGVDLPKAAVLAAEQVFNTTAARAFPHRPRVRGQCRRRVVPS